MSGILIIGGFFVFAALMIMKVLPTILALPLMAAWIAFVVQMPLVVYLNNILLAGAMKLGTAMAVVIFGAMFAQVIMKTGISGTIIKKAAELAGDKPRSIAIILSFATMFVFMGMSGLGAAIMVGSIVLPIMMSAGISPLLSSVVFLLAIQTGLLVNAANYGTFIGIFGGEVTMSYYVPAFAISLLVSLVCIFVNIKGSTDKSESGTSFLTILGILLKGIIMLPKNICVSFYEQIAKATTAKSSSLVVKKDNVPAAALLAPILPLVTVYVFRAVVGFGKAAEGHVDPVAASVLGFFLASVYAILLTKPGQLINILAGSITEGIKDVAGVIFLFMGIGMLVAAVMDQTVAKVLNPLLLSIVPTHPWTVFAFFAICAPTALYRGPLNMFGMGVGIAALIGTLHILPGAVVVGTFLAVEYIQGASDPTNSHNTWIGGFTNVDTTEILKKTLPYTWGMCLLLLLYVTLMRW